ncbi:MAG: hypothetical protein JWN34_4043 [Bryobacterales bacterium]|nr:hypothetical protein [Bryobacterales bacterium]
MDFDVVKITGTQPRGIWAQSNHALAHLDGNTYLSNQLTGGGAGGIGIKLELDNGSMLRTTLTTNANTGFGQATAIDSGVVVN